MRIMLIVAAVTIIIACVCWIKAMHDEPIAEQGDELACLGISDFDHKHCVYQQDVAR